MRQPIPKNVEGIRNTNKGTYTLLIDGNSLLKVAFHADTTVNSRGEHIGGVFQFLLQMKIMLSKRDFDFVYVFWDGINSGELKFAIYPEYKMNRDKNYDINSIDSDYYKQIDNFTKAVLGKKNKETSTEKLNQKAQFHKQKEILEEYLEELFVRQVSIDKIEGDDLIAYYCNNKREDDKIYIMSGDRDLTQLISEYTSLYDLRLKTFITKNNHKELLGIPQENVLINKILCGDVSDNIKGIKGLAEKTLLKIIPEIKERRITLGEVVDRCKVVNEERVKNKKKPLKTYENVVNQVSSGVNNGRVFEINERIINLKNPMVNKEAIEEMENIMYAPIDGEGRSMENLFKLVHREGIVDLLDSNRFSTFFSTFNKSINKEKEFYKKWLKNNG